MDNRKYEALIHIAETGSITQTAALMGYTQSGITQMIRSMEQELGVQLLVRSNKGVRLTPSGSALLPYMRGEHRYEEHIRQECDRMRGKRTGSVTVGCLSSVSTGWMPTILEEFSKECPDIRVHMVEGEAPELGQMLQEGRIDLSITEISADEDEFTHILLKDEIFAVLPKGHPLTREPKISITRLAEYPFISFYTGTGASSERGWPETVAGKRNKFNVMYICHNDITAIEMVKHNLGVTLAGDLMIRNYPNDIAIVPLDPPKFRTLGLCTRQKETLLPATEAFIGCAKSILKR